MNLKNDKLIKYPVLNVLIRMLQLKNASDRTILNYVDGISRFLDFIQYDNSFTITVEHFQDYLFYLNSTDLNKKSVNASNSYLRFFFGAVLDIPVNTYKVPMAHTISKDITILQNCQIIDLLNASSSNSRDDLILKLGLCCGLRINEVASLRICDIHTRDKTNKYIYVSESKRNKSRYVPMDNTVYRAIQRYAKEFHIIPGSNDLLFHFRKGTTRNYNETIRCHFDRLTEEAGIQNVTFHSLRHTYAVNYLINGGQLNDLKYLLGHSSLATTSIYLRHAIVRVPNVSSFVDKLYSQKDGVR